MPTKGSEKWERNVLTQPGLCETSPEEPRGAQKSAMPLEAALKQEPPKELQSRQELQVLEATSVHTDLPFLRTSGQLDRKNHPPVPGSWSRQSRVPLSQPAGAPRKAQSQPWLRGRCGRQAEWQARCGHTLRVHTYNTHALHTCLHTHAHVHVYLPAHSCMCTTQAHACVHMYAYLCTHTHICTHVCTCMHTCTRLPVCVHTFTYLHTHTHMQVYNTHAHVSLHACIHVSTCTLIYTYTRTTYVHTQTHMYTYTCMHRQAPHPTPTISGTGLQISKQRPEHTAAREHPGSKQPGTPTAA